MTALGSGSPFERGDDNVARLRVPPHSTEAEQGVLGALLLDNASMERISDLLRADDFYRFEHSAIFGAISTLLEARKPADILTVAEHFAGQLERCGGLQYLNALVESVPSAANIRNYAEIVRSKAVLRRVISVSDEIATLAFNSGTTPIDTVLSDVEEKLAELQREQQRKIPDRRVPLLSLDALQEASHSIRWLIKHVVPAESLGMMFGGSGTFKSFISLDLALHVAHGLPWLGRRTTQGSVIYIAAEGGAGLWPRIDAWHRARNLRWSDIKQRFRVVPVAVDLGTEAWRVVDAAQAVGQTPSLVLVDTLSQTFGGEENSAAEMAAYLKALGARFRALWGCAVLVIHHSGHLATERPRGSSAIRGNVDFLMGVFRDEKEMLATLTCTKQKDGDTFDDTTFSLSKFRLGTDEDGDEVTSLVARHLTSAEEVEEAMRIEAKAGRIGKNQLLLTLVQNGMKESELRKVFGDECGIENLESRKRVFNRAKAWAVQHGYIEVAAGIVITLKKD